MSDANRDDGPVCAETVLRRHARAARDADAAAAAMTELRRELADLDRRRSEVHHRLDALQRDMAREHAAADKLFADWHRLVLEEYEARRARRAELAAPRPGDR